MTPIRSQRRVSPRAVQAAVICAAIAASACASGAKPRPAPAPAPGQPVRRVAEPPREDHLPAVPLVTGPLRLQVVYPAATDQVDVRDSTFLLGSVGTGDAHLTINGQPVEVAPNGTWLAWIAVPPDSIMNFVLLARTANDSVSLSYQVRRVHRFTAPATRVWVDSTSISPRGRAWWPSDEYLPISVRAVAGAEVNLVLPDGRRIRLTPDLAPAEVPWGIRAFDRDSNNLAPVQLADRYVGAIRGVRVGEDPGPLLGGQTDRRTDGQVTVKTPSGTTATTASSALSASFAATPTIEAIIGTDTARVLWRLQLGLMDSTPQLVEFNDDTARKGDTDSLTIGRARPGATYHWFMPTGTRAMATGRLGDDLRIRLSRGTEAWVPAGDALALPAGTPVVRATVGSVTMTRSGERLALRIPLSFRVPFRVEEADHRLTLRLYNSLADINWMRYGSEDPYLANMSWLQDSGDEVAIDLALAGVVWGYRTRWSGTDLILEIRRPPPIRADHPLAGRRIVIDPGHPPAGATGPSGFREAQANLAVALRLRDLLVAAGADVIMTRTSDSPIDLLPRVKLADSVNAELLISIHNNALPDGVNPYSNNGASVFYNHPRSEPLAQAVQRALVRRLGVRDLGVGRGDLALVRPTWMPAVLTEGLFMMIPEQEAALRSPEGQAAYAQAVFEGIETFLRGVASGATANVP